MMIHSSDRHWFIGNLQSATNLEIAQRRPSGFNSANNESIWSHLFRRSTVSSARSNALSYLLMLASLSGCSTPLLPQRWSDG